MKLFYLFIFNLSFITVSCTSQKLNNISTPVTDINYRYETERLSILPPIGNNWEMVNYETTGAISFYSYNQGSRNLHIGVQPFPYHISANNFNKFLQEELLAVKVDQSKIDRGNYMYKYSHKVYVSTKAGMRCITREVFNGATKYRGNTITIDYFCEQPNQPNDFPLIKVSFSDSVVPGLQLSDPDIIMAPIWNSIKFKPVDRTKSIAYQDWKIKNSKLREQKKRNNENAY